MLLLHFPENSFHMPNALPAPSRALTTEFIRHDPAVCMTPGLFRSLTKGCERAKLKVVHDFGDGRRLEFDGPDQLGVDDLRVLQGIVSLAQNSHRVVSHDAIDATGQSARNQLCLADDARPMDVLVMNSAYAELAREIGYAKIDNTAALRTCVERMCKVSVIAEVRLSGRRSRRLFHLVAGYSSDEQCGSGRLRVALNPQITEIMLGMMPQHSRIDMREVRSLKSDPARLIHQRLCGWIDPGKYRRVTIDTLCGYAWPDVNPGAIRMRRVIAKKAIQELIGIGWQVEEYEPKKYKITRPGAERKLISGDDAHAEAA